MTKKRRMFDVELPEEPAPAESLASSPSARRGPMATAIGETADTLRQRAAVESAIRQENDALAHEFVRTVSRLNEMQSKEFLALERRMVDTGLT